MASLLSLRFHAPPSPFLSSLSHGSRRDSAVFLPPMHGRRPFARTVVARGLGHEFELGGGLAQEMLTRVESLIFTLADVADAASAVAESSKQAGSGDWLSGITNYMETVLKILKDGLSAVHVPYAYGFAIILLTVLVKAVTFPLTKKQVESALAMRSLQPQVKAIQQRHAGDQERIQLETARLYKLAGLNPLAGCLPTLATIPVWIGLYRALSNVADEGLLTEGFFWIPSLSGPTTIAARQNGGGISWLFPFKDGQPPLGWSDTFAYLVLPALLIISQYVSVQVMQQPSQSDDPSQKNAQAITKFLPLLIGYFALSVPSGLSLYWLTNNILSTAQQVWLQKLGGAKNPVKEYIDKFSREEQYDSSSKSSSEMLLQPPPPPVTAAIREDTVGVRRGERFKQIKEQEARKKQLKEPSDSSTRVYDENNNQGFEDHREEVALPASSNGRHATVASDGPAADGQFMVNGELQPDGESSEVLSSGSKMRSSKSADQQVESES